MKKITLFILLFFQSLTAQEPALFENPADYPLMGDWEGRWINPVGGHEKWHPELYAQLMPMEEGRYRVVILPDLYSRAQPYLNLEVAGSHDLVEIEAAGFEVVFEGTEVTGKAILHGSPTSFELKKTTRRSPTLGKSPPEGAVVLFDGTNTEAWKHLDDREVTWCVRDGVLEVQSEFWNEGKNRENGIGGMIATQQGFRDFRLHLEFRYPVESGKEGQARGNSGLFLHSVGEIQILNSYQTPGYYDECGAIYRMTPAKVNAAGPPLQWQTYDVELRYLPNDDSMCELTVKLNGHLIHNRLSLKATAPEVRIMLQDHINRIQFRNIWVDALNP